MCIRDRQRRPSGRLADDLDLQPAYALADARSQGLGSCLLGGKPGGKAFRGRALAPAVGLFRAGVHTVEKAAAIAVHGLLDLSLIHI